MNSILAQYFDRLKSLSLKNELEYYVYERDSVSRMPYSVHLRFFDRNGSQNNSWGSGISKDEAFGKALMEMIERIYFSGFSPFEYKNLFGFFSSKVSLMEISNKFNVPIKIIHPANTNGVAIHLSSKKSAQSAMFELIERHTILYALVSGIGPGTIIKKWITPSKYCRFYVWKSPLGTFTVVGAFVDKVGAYFSSGCDYVLDKAILKAELELNSYLFLNEVQVKNSSIIKDNIQSFNLYHKFSGDKSAVDFFETAKPRKIPDLDKAKFYFAPIPLPQMFIGLQPLPCVRVIHPDVQQLFFDNWKNEYLNPRLFKPNQTLPLFPHIIA